MTDDADAVITLAYEQGLLKRISRTGWWHIGVKYPESVAEHSFRSAQLAGLIASMEGADPARASFMSLWHDSQETRIGDIPHSGRQYISVSTNEEITADQTAGLPDDTARLLKDAVAEYETTDTLEAKCAKDADKLECLLQAVEYGEQGYQRTEGWIESSMKKLQTKSAQRLAEAALRISPLAWRDR